MSDLTQNLKPYCTGRYLIDMPADVLMTGGATVQGVRIESKAMTHEAYLQEVASRKAELRGTKSIDPYPFLYADDAIDGPDTHYFVYRGNLSDGPANRVFEAYKWDRGYRFKLGIVGTDFLHPDQTSDPIVQQINIKNDVPRKTQLIFDLVKRLRWRSEDEIPREPGLCFFGAFLPGKATDKEDVGTQFVFRENLDVSIGVGSDSDIRESNTLLQRSAEVSRDLSAIGGKTVRKGTVKLQGIDAEEWLLTGKTDLGIQGTKCLLEANSTTSDAQSPLLTLELNTGSPNAFMRDRINAASMSVSEAVAVWDIVSRTLRPRPNGF
ncbi:T6SS immunity protein Tli4 family protein [Paraburkholderia sp. CNPSo 3272]|uniref:T6SS immunity protein Tli4 family protein n=1 Tax=Paraburkholderia sp. CNPSo 3272 TaxID=2940931 RepID=UPI0020B68A37|nr:T6SS immunity protein Tli4 family protein [Paraburkholderia sp. CNPSo 3272]MCP3728145.1 T6SS immunity protein Tli4 family protein [Paraburkholderia sp. CNPSo 3272]